MGYEKYRLDDHWGTQRKIIPAEKDLFNLQTQWDDTDTAEAAERSKNPCVDGVCYYHNSLGYRGPEPAWAKSHVVFIGDENTKCVGVDKAHMWTSLVVQNHEKSLQEINLGRDGASNDWIAAQAIRVIELHQSPMVIQWTDPARYLYVDTKARYRDFIPDKQIPRDSLFVPNQPEEARQVFYDVDTGPNGMHRLLMNVTLVEQLASVMNIPLVHVFSFIEPSVIQYIASRVPKGSILRSVREDHTARDGIHCGNAAMYRLSEWVLSVLRIDP